MEHRVKTPKPPLPRWNWGAFLLTWIWGVGNRVWISLLALIPGVNIFMAFYLGLKGNGLAWERSRYLNLSEFKKAQKLWLRWGIGIFLVITLLAIGSLALSAYLANKSDGIVLRDARRITDVRIIVTQINHFKVDHSGACPTKLEELVPNYMEVIPLDPNNQSYLYSAKGNDCVVSATLEDPENGNLLDDANPGNGKIFDQNAEDLNDYMFYEE